jgi:hypothetical protein
MGYTLLSSVLTLIGVALGVIATLAADNLRWQREAARHKVLDRRQLHEQYLSNLHQAGENQWALAQGDDRTLTAGPALAATAWQRACSMARQNIEMPTGLGSCVGVIYGWRRAPTSKAQNDHDHEGVPGDLPGRTCVERVGGPLDGPLLNLIG